jgi:tetratricopeptide (TPR) repeat protein
MTLRVRLQQIDGERAKLQTLLDAHLRTRNQVAVGVAGLAGELSASDDPEIKTGAGRLQTLVDDLIKDHPLDDLPMDQAWVVRVAQGTAAIGRGDFDAALRHVPSKALADLRNLEIVALKVRGDAYYGKREWSSALNAYTQLTTLQPGDLQARLLAGNCQVHIGRVEDAERTYTEAIALPPNTPAGRDENVWRVAALNNRGNLHSMAGRYAQAFEDFSRGLHTLRALPTNENRQIGAAVLLANRGYVLQQLTRTKEANADRAEARRLIASVPRARRNVIEWLDERTTPVTSHEPRQTTASRQATAPKLASVASANDATAPGSPSQPISAGVTGTSKPTSPESQPGPVGAGEPAGTASRQSEPKHAAQKNCFMCHAAEPAAPASPK